MTTYYDDRFAAGDVVDAPAGWRQLLGDRQLWTALAVAAVLAGAFAVAAEFVLVRPLAEDRDATRAERERLAAENREHEATLVEYEAFLRTKAEVDRRYEAATMAVPTDAELATVLESIRALAVESRMQLVSFDPEPARPTAGSALEKRKVRILVRGGFEELKRLTRALGAFPRLLTTDAITVRHSAREGYTLEAVVAITCYFKASPAAAR